MKRNPVVMPQTLIVEAHNDHIVAIIRMNQSTIGLRFVSPEHLLATFNQLMEKAAIVWPDNALIKEYLSDELGE